MKKRLCMALACLPVYLSQAEALDGCAVRYLDTSRHDLPVPQAKITRIDITSNAIFDESAPDTMALHRLANWLHINTKTEVIAERLPFAEGDTVTSADLAEAERILRQQAYIRDARVTISGDCSEQDPAIVNVETWDNWSMIPTVSFSHKGGESKFSVGIKEDNLLGLGIRTRFKYNTDEQRSGYQLTLHSATPMLLPHSTLMLDFMDNDDGNLVDMQFEQPFYDARSDSMLFARYLSDTKVVDIFHNGEVRNSFASQSHRYELATGWQFSNAGLNSLRYAVGWVDEAFDFMPADLSHSEPDALLPQDRRFQYVWLGIESLQRDFKLMQDIYLIDQAEDINLGWHYQAKLGVDFAHLGSGDLAYLLEFKLNKGWQLDKGLVLMSAAGEGSIKAPYPDHYLLSTQLEYFRRYNRLLAMYARVAAATERNPRLDMPQNVGDDSGVRGYPLQYQHGEHSVSGSLEARLYSGYNIFKILDVGFAGFVDVGRAWGGRDGQLNESQQVLSSVGLGARLFSNRSSHRSVVHLDMVKPLISGEHIDSWAWRAQVKQSF